MKLAPQLAAFMKWLKARKAGLQDTGDAVHGPALREVEQEREVAYEGWYLPRLLGDSAENV